MKETALPTTTASTQIDYRSDIRTALLESLVRDRHTRKSYYRIIVRIPEVDPLRWVGDLDHSERFYWSGRSHDDIVAGAGHAAVVERTGALDYASLREEVFSHLLAAPSGARFFGGIRFDHAGTRDSDWNRFPTYRFVMPRFEMRSVDGASLLICNIGPDDDHDQVLAEIDRLSPLAGSSSPKKPQFVGRENTPRKADWDHAIDWSLSAFSSTTLAKVVLARRARLTFDSDVEPFELLMTLARNTPNCYHFIFSRSGSSFLGASPEMLFQKVGSAIRSEAVAGTAARGDTEGADRRLGRRLLLSEKDQREHEYVRQSIKEVLTDVTRVLHVDTTASDMKLAQGRHLRSDVSGVLKEGVDAVDLLRALHPTPAVGGHPQDEAMDVIRHLEPFDRGWYAGPVGWISDDGAEFAVAIRSGLSRGRILDLFSGAGIVCGSDANLEWDEVEQKIGDFLKALSLDNRR